MNEKIYDLIFKILDSRLPVDTQEEIARFYLLPRNTPIKPVLEQEPEREDLGVIRRPDAHTELRRRNPKLAGEEDAMRDTLREVLKSE